MLERINDIHRMSRRSYGSRRVHDELVLGEGRRVSRKRIERLMRVNNIVGIHKRRRGCTRRDPDATPADDLVNRQFTVDGPDRLWVSDITEHPTGEGKVYVAVVLDAWSRRVIGWSIADHIRAELVVDALQMAIWRRRPPEGQTVHHSDHGSQYTSWAFGRRLRCRRARLDGLHRRCLRQRHGRIVLLDDATRTPRRAATMGDASSARASRVRVDRSLVQPPPPTLLDQRCEPCRLRSRQPRRRTRIGRVNQRGALEPAVQLLSEARDQRGWYEHTRRSQPLAIVTSSPHPNRPGNRGKLTSASSASTASSAWAARRSAISRCPNCKRTS